MSVDAVFFDIGGVLVHADLYRYAEVAGTLFGSGPEALLEVATPLIPELETGNIDSLGFWRVVGERLWARGAGQPLEQEKCRWLWRDILKASLRLDLHVLHLCWTLSRKHLVVAALSNTIADHAVELEAIGAYEPFHPLILSFEHGLRKPDPAFYELALQKVGMQSKRCLLIDDLEENVEAARRAGWKTHLFAGHEPLHKDLERLRLL
ncbi:MAG: HAD-IA family hydrolase [Candidatus Eremiobacteraeota bacterium]|nr:HAD-IA family hydrolase [Candidatus Eremiobacteraeota bacterium]